VLPSISHDEARALAPAQGTCRQTGGDKRVPIPMRKAVLRRPRIGLLGPRGLLGRI
jgi:hypothetical protein